ncbi:D-tyrosyl-tRNA(Tyr) deacylase [Mycobacterium kansasii]|uniref:D-aminoacyl-tRNA deacylase n=1 Tax=Mycobacterium kansasii TaxID=1768 RepID=UPI0009EF7BDB|nr:D-aminoacyl-tRNA deacylase [Mycobacterium kansasii]ARG64452.1 D-tyrosyl-tRNA(Tyr) deacylase [Mycobacterium kansasii]
MRVLVQRVSSASVVVDDEVVGAIRPERQGPLAFVGATHTDDPDKAQRLAEKLWNLRILDDEKSACDINAPILVISQFTLYADTAKGRRPSWTAAAPAAAAEPLVQAFADALGELGAHVQTGVFGAHMHVELVNDGPVTVMLEL